MRLRIPFFSKRTVEPETEPLKRKEPYMGKRGFSAAELNRLTSGWVGTHASKNQQIEQGSVLIRRRARQLSNDNDYVRRYLSMVKANVVGTNGIVMQSKIKTTNGKPDEAAIKLIERRWREWVKWGNCTIDGHLSWVDVQNMVMETVARDGEMLMLMLPDRASRSLRLQPIDIDRLETEHTDYNRNIRMSIEYNDRRQPIAYWILTKHPADQHGYIRSERKRYPADMVIHAYRAEHPEQERGIIWMASSMTRLNMLGGFEEAALVNARIGASKMGFFTSPDGEGYSGDATVNGQMISEAEPGHFEQLPDGVAFTPFDPQYPSNEFQPFMKTVLRGIASGLNVSYNGLASDLEGVNFSSIRSGVIDERDQWRSNQRWLIDSVMQRVFSKWLDTELLFGGLGGYDVRDFDRLNAVTWQPRGWAWVDPQKDINASILAIDNGLKTRADVIAESGKDIDEVFEQLQQEQELLEKYKLKLKQEGNSNAGTNPNEKD